MINRKTADEQEDVPTPGATRSAQIIENLQMLKATHGPCKDLTKLHKAHVFVNPNNGRKYLLLSKLLLSLWARALATFFSTRCKICAQKLTL